MDGPSNRLLLKGLEEEVYTGLPDGRIVGMADEIARCLPGFRTEPDLRNPEFALPALREYADVSSSLLEHRGMLRDWLERRGGYTLVPGATLSTGDSSRFELSDPSNAYYRYIDERYGTRVVTASAHISIGLDDDETIVRAARVLRMEACLLLALTAASPFLDGRATGFHSTRWAAFPHTPAGAPLFRSHDHYATYVREAVADRRMMNTRHLWTSARPNGEDVPDGINRVEVRVCDRIDDARLMLAVTGLVEARVQMIVADPAVDPLVSSTLPTSTRADDLVEICQANEAAVAERSLDAEVRDWRDGRPVPVRAWLDRFHVEALATARTRGFDAWLAPIRDVLDRGNTAMRWLERHARGASVAEIIRSAIVEATRVEAEQRRTAMFRAGR